MRTIKKTNLFKIAVILLILLGGLTYCYHEDRREEDTPCYPRYGIMPYIPPWVYDFVAEHLENDFFGRMYRCVFKDGLGRDGYGFLIEAHEETDTVYSFINCEGEVLYEREPHPIKDAYPELEIRDESLFMGKYPTLWEHDKTSDESLCYFVNPFTLPLVKEMIYRCTHHRCAKRVFICTYRDGKGFLMGEHLASGDGAHMDFLDCSGNLLCNITKSGESSYSWCDLDIDWDNGKIILELTISLNVN